MYGLINNAIRELTIEKCGHEAWNRIADALDVTTPFISMKQYPDALTLQLLDGLALTLGLSRADALLLVGRHWVQMARRDYAELFEGLGGSFIVALQNLDILHVRVGLSFPALKAPSFRCTDITGHGMTLHYHSSREGLAPMVIGLIEGLAEAFDTPVRVAPGFSRVHGNDHDTFEIRFTPVKE